MAAMEWSERTRLLITIAVAVAVNAGVWGFTYKARGEYLVLCKKKRVLDEELVGMRREKARRDELESELARLKRDYQKREARLPENPIRSELDREISEMAQQLKMGEKSRRSEVDKITDIPGLGAQFRKDVSHTQWEADFGALGQFINRLEEHFKYIIAVENLSIMAKEAGMNVTGAKHDVSFDVISYRYIGKTQ
jgi:Tfp pilus assembly protein PilO